MSGQKFIARNRAPRVQIEYDVELYGAQKKVQLPFVMGVFSDLSGKSEQPPIADRKFLEIDVDNFDERMRAIAPRAQFSVPNTLTGEGNLSVDLTFNRMDDFSPEAIAENVDALRPLLEARRQLTNLATYMDGKTGAEALIEKLLADPALLAAVSSSADTQTDTNADNALETLRGALVDPPKEGDTTDDTLAALSANAPTDSGPDTSADDALSTLTPPPEDEKKDEQQDALESLRTAPTPEVEDTDTTDDVLGGIERLQDVSEPDEAVEDVLATLEPIAEQEEDVTSAVLDGIAKTPLDDGADTDETTDVLASIEYVHTPEEQDQTDDILGDIAAAAPGDTEEADDVAGILGDIEHRAEAEVEDHTSDILETMASNAPDEVAETDDTADIIAGIERVDDLDTDDDTDDILQDMAVAVPDHAPETDQIDDVLADVQRVDEAELSDQTDDILAALDAPADAADEDAIDDILGSIDAIADDTEDEASTDDVLGELERVVTPADDETETLDDILSDVAATETDDDQPNNEADDILAGLEAPGPAPETEAGFDDVLAGIESHSPPADDADENADDILADIASLETTDSDEDPDELGDILAGIETELDEDVSESDLNDILASVETEVSEPTPDDDLDDILSGLDSPATETEEVDDLENILGGLEAPDTAEDETGLGDVLSELATTEAEEVAEEDPVSDILAGLEAPEDDDAADADIDDILTGLDTPTDTAENDTDLDDILSGLEGEDDEAESQDDLDDLLAGLDDDDSSDADTVGDLDDILAAAEDSSEDNSADETDLNDVLAGLEDESDDGSLDDVLADLDASDEESGEDIFAATDETEADDLDDILAGLDDSESDDASDLDDILAGLDDQEASGGTDDLDDILGALDETVDDDDTEEAASPEPTAPPQSPFGKVVAERPAREDLNRRKFRMALFGDFTGRASRGVIEIGDALATRKPILLDVDTIDDVIEGFATTLQLKIGKEGGTVPISLKELDDLHPDELYDNIEMFQEISGLRQSLGMGSMAEKTTAQLKAWSDSHATPIKLPKRSASTSVPANLKLSDFQALIGDTSGALTPTGPADDLIAQIVGPHIVKAPDDGAAEMTKAVDDALSSAMRLILHHPDFQAIEAQWRSLDMLARRIETDSDLEIVLYDVSAEELAADLAANEDLGESGLFKLVTDVLDPEEGAGGFSALFGLYTFEETPPHAELLARIGQVGAHVDAPFFAAISPGYLDIAKEDRHPLVAEAWDTLRTLPEAAYLALSSPRFLLRLPYGAKSDPIYPFDFEEFTPQEGLRGMLWANPVVLVAILLAGTYKKDGKAMDLGSLMSLGDLPFHYVNDRHGDQVALPCTERNLSSDAAQQTLGRAYMPVVWIKGRNEIRLGTFRSLGGDIIAGPWEAEVPAPRPRPGRAGQTVEMDIDAGDSQDSNDLEEVADDDLSMDDLMSDLDDDSGGDDDTSLDDLLAGFDDDGDEDDEDDDEMDAELAALLEGL